MRHIEAKLPNHSRTWIDAMRSGLRPHPMTAACYLLTLCEPARPTIGDFVLDKMIRNRTQNEHSQSLVLPCLAVAQA